ncbi:MAG: response regulator [Candidatus Aureabacteria bacterium]|nr:response regulator [Candidatus Auribacterota bacterium]
MAALSSAAKRDKILVIEDDSQVADMISMMLQKKGFDSLVASDGVEAVSKLMSGDIRLILLDIMMPFFSGYWFCDVFKRNPITANIPVVIVSALDTQGDIEKALKLGADGYVTKPFTEEGLMREIKSVLEKRGERAKKKRSRKK